MGGVESIVPSVFSLAFIYRLRLVLVSFLGMKFSFLLSK